jgi:hypothetical protein
MDWGLGNPNKTAALIAMLMISVCGFGYLRKWGFWLGLLAFAGMGICLIHTFSRGGLFALIICIGIMMWKSSRPWLLSRSAAVAVAFLIIGCSTLFLGAHRRFGQGITEEDASIANRLAIWRKTPGMMVDAPGGWGYGKSGSAYTQWYQPLTRFENYRTLVNSHLTWMVEFGWMFRYGYLAGWLAVLVLCWPPKGLEWLVIPFCIWISFALSAFFSSVAESPWLWILPASGLIAALAGRNFAKRWPSFRSWIFVFLAPLCALSLVFVSGKLEPGTPLHYSSGQVVVGELKKPQSWAVLDTKMTGNYGRELRRYVQSQTNAISIGVTESLDQLPEKVSGPLLIVAKVPLEDLPQISGFSSMASTITLINPQYSPYKIELYLPSNVRVMFGEFSESPALSEWKSRYRVETLSGTGDFVPHWPELFLRSAPQL